MSEASRTIRIWATVQNRAKHIVALHCCACDVLRGQRPATIRRHNQALPTQFSHCEDAKGHAVLTAACQHPVLAEQAYKSCEDVVTGGGRGALGFTKYRWFVYNFEVSPLCLGASWSAFLHNSTLQ
jgi:hypothetical protein